MTASFKEEVQSSTVSFTLQDSGGNLVPATVTWQPAPEAWAKVEEARKADVEVVASTNYGQAQTEKEKVATTRGLGLDQSAPAPSVIRMSASTKAPVLVTVLNLIHK